MPTSALCRPSSCVVAPVLPRLLLPCCAAAAAAAAVVNLDANAIKLASWSRKLWSCPRSSGTGLNGCDVGFNSLKMSSCEKLGSVGDKNGCGEVVRGEVAVRDPPFYKTGVFPMPNPEISCMSRLGSNVKKIARPVFGSSYLKHKQTIS